MKKLCLLVFLLIHLSFALGATTANAQTVSSGHALGGLSLMMENFYKAGGKLYEEEDLNLLSEVIFHENYCNGDYIMRLTGSVVLNRVEHAGFPNSIHDVLYQKGQYSTTSMFFTKNIPAEVRQIARELLIFGSIAPRSVIFQSMFLQGSGVYYTENGEYFCYE